MLLIAIVSLQFILLQYSCAPFVLTKKLYIYISAVVHGLKTCKKLNSWIVVMQKKSHMNHTCKHNLTKHLTILPLCTQQVGPKG